VIAGTGVAVVAGAAGFTWFAVAGPAPRTGPSTGENSPSDGTSGTPTALATVADIPEGGGIVLADQSVVLTRETGDKVHGFSAVCTHQGCLVNQVSGGRITCPCHGSAFDSNTGAVVDGPAPSPLPTVAVTVVNGSVYTG
jgi:Rieske Fe-S protein